MDRRKFNMSLAGLFGLLTAPEPTSQPAAPSQVPQIHNIAVHQEISRLEDHLAQYPNAFTYDVHNQLRHLYSACDVQRSMRHADTILAHSVKDSYMLTILGNWHIDDDRDLGMASLLNHVHRYPTLLHLCAACLLKLGNLCQPHASSEAQTYYRRVITLVNQYGGRLPTLRPYWNLAQYRLRT